MITAKPKITDNLTGYLFNWAEYGITVHANHLRMHSTDGRVTGQIFVEAETEQGAITIYPPTSCNFSADRTRKELTKSLQSKNGKLPWPDMVEQLCYGVQERIRRGEGVRELCTSAKAPPPEYVIHPLIVKNYTNIIFGDPSSLKSTVAVILAQIIQLPWKDNPLGLTAPTRSIKAMYADWETDGATIQWQTTLLRNGHLPGIELALQYIPCSMPLAQSLDRLKGAVVEYDIDVVIIDSLGLAAGGELKDTQSPLAFFGALRTLNVTSLVLAHNSKDRETKVRSIYGNQYFTAQARNIWEIRKQQDPGSSEVSIAMFHRKPPPFAGVHHPLGFKLEFTMDSMVIKPSDPKNVGEFLEQMGLKAQIQEALKGGYMDIKELADELDRPVNQVRARCNEMRRQGLLTKNGNDWGLLRDDE
jgi:hypothetical protein